MSTIGNSASAVDAQQVFNSLFTELINEDYSIGTDTKNYQGVLLYLLSSWDKPIKKTMLLTVHRKKFAEKYNDEIISITLLMMLTGLISYNLW